MTDWMKSLFSDPKTLGVLGASGLIGFIVGVVNGSIAKRRGGWGDFFGTMATGVGIAVIVGLGIHDHVKSEAFRLAIVGVCAVISEDIWAGIRAVGRLIREDPLGGLVRIIQAFRGQPISPPTAPPSQPPGSPTGPRLRPRDPDSD